MTSFSTTRTEHLVIQRIADRAEAMALQEGVAYPRVDAAMDITAVHANGCPLRLDELLAADPFNFAHDIFGIRRYLNRNTGVLENHFTPRFGRGKQ